ncbi:MAG: response regulator [Nanoarchaeota archaeon]
MIPIKALVIDDEEVVAKFILASLKRMGVDASSKIDGRSGVEEYRTGHQNGGYDLVLSDVIMPGFTGVEVMKAILGIDPDANIYGMTGESYGRDGAIDAILGPGRLLKKPFSKEDLPRIVQPIGTAKLREMVPEAGGLEYFMSEEQLKNVRPVAENLQCVDVYVGDTRIGYVRMGVSSNMFRVEKVDNYNS